MTTRRPHDAAGWAERGRRVPGVERLAVLRANAIGDFVVTVPALEALRRAYPRAQLTLIGDTWHRAVLSGRPGPWDRVVVAPSYPGLRGRPFDALPGPDYEGFVGEQLAESYDLVVQLHGGGRTSNEVVNALKPRVSAGARTPEAPPLDRWVPYRMDQHETLRCLEIVELVGAGLRSVRDLEPRLAVTAADLEQSAVVVPGDVDVVVHAGANDPRRRWPVSRFAELIDRLTAAGRHVVLVGGEGDREIAARLRATVRGGFVDTVGRLSLPATLGLLARARSFVGNDSGPRHLAGAVGVPTVGIYWAPNLRTFGPLVGDHRAVVAYPQPATTHPAGSAAGFENGSEDGSAVGRITVGEVLAAVDQLGEKRFAE